MVYILHVPVPGGTCFAAYLSTYGVKRAEVVEQRQSAGCGTWPTFLTEHFIVYITCLCHIQMNYYNNYNIDHQERAEENALFLVVDNSKP